MKKWTREETIVAFNVYCKIPFGRINMKHPMIVAYAKILGRSASALCMKACNIARLDSDLKDRGISGLVHGAKMEEEVWNEFLGDSERLAYESELIIARLSNKSIEDMPAVKIENLPEGLERNVIIKQRVNQSFFRETVLSAYNYKCCISGVKSDVLLEACHIVEWSKDEKNRVNPRNGLCLNPFFHKAYDANLIGISPDMKIVISDKLFSNLENNTFFNYMKGINGETIFLPDKFLPQKDFLAYRYDIFRKHL